MTEQFVDPIAAMAVAPPPFPEAEAALAALAAGRMIVVSRPEGSFLMADAARITPDMINQMATHGRGLVGLALPLQRAAELGLSFQARRGRPGAPLYTQSIEARQGVETGISAADRARTIHAACLGGPEDLATPGHIFPYVPEGRPLAQADLALALLTQARCPAMAATCPVLDDEGAAADPARAERLASRLGLIHFNLHHA